MTLIPKFEMLEDRIVLDGTEAIPEVTITGPAEPVELGQQDVGFTLTFNNDGTESGYVPYAELIIPTSGGDGEGDGPTFDSASFLGGDIDTTVLTFDVNGEVEHPFLLDPSGDPLIVTGGAEGDTLVVFELPYGSFSPGNPPVDIDVIIDFSDQADLGSMPEFQALGGFALGCDALDNPDVDAPIRGALFDTDVDPRLFEVTKANNAPESEAATGPSYIYTYTLTVDVAPGQTLDNFTLTDNLPPEIVYMGNVTFSGGVGGVVTTEPTVGVQVQPLETFVADFTEVSDTVTVTFDYWISNDPSDSVDPTNDPTTGVPTPVTNTVVGDGTWNPLDQDDTQGVPVSDGDTNVLQASTLAIQKTNAVLTDANAAGASPGDIYTFTLNVQVSDYFTFGDLVIEDVLGDGWDYIEGSADFYTVENVGDIGGVGAEESLTGVEVVTAIEAVDPLDMMLKPTGETSVSWDISQAMIDQGEDGLLTGDLAGPALSTGSQTRVVITYEAQILEDYTDSGSGEQSISQGDSLMNDVTVTGDVRDNFNDGGDPTVATMNELSNASQNEIPIATGQIESKTVFALNGETEPPADVVIAAGDTVTFQIIYRAPLAAFEQFRIEDNLPQLVFDPATEFDPVGSVWNTSPADDEAPPAAGEAYFGSSTSANLLGLVPTISTDGPNNGLIFEFGEFTDPTPQEAVIEILFTTTVQDAIFADDLLLTNQATAFETNTFGEEISSTAIAKFDYGEPVLNVTKGVVASDSTDPETAFVNGPTGLSGVSVPDAGSPRFTGSVTSAGLDTAPVDANIEAVDAGDTVTFAIVLENTGSAPNGAFNVTVTDTLPDEFVIPPSGLNLSVTDGTGTAIGFTRPDGTAATANDIFGTGLMLNDDGPLEGALSTFNSTSGENVIVVTYDLLMVDDVSPNTISTNTAGIATYNAFEGNGLPLDLVNGPVNRVISPIEDVATATTEFIEITKVIDPGSREFNADISGRSNNEVAVGEEFEFIVRVDVPEGEMFEFNVSDSVTNGGLTLISAEIETFGSAMDSSTDLGEGLPTDTTVAVGNAWSFDFGTLTNAGDNDPTNDFIEIRVFALAADDDVGNANHFMRNVAQVSFEDADMNVFTDTDPANIRLIEPRVALDKTASPAIVDAGGTVNYQVEITNPSGFRDAPAFDLTLTDTLDPNLTLDVDPGDITLLVNGVATAFDGTNYALSIPPATAANTFEVFIDQLDQDDVVVVQYSGVADPDIPAGLTIPNTAGLTYDSTPEDDSGADNDDRDYSLTDTEEVVTRAPDIDKSVLDGSTSYDETTGNDLGVGELVTYELVVTIPEGVINDVVLTDTLPTGMEYVSSEVVRIGNVTGVGTAGPADRIGGSDLNVGDMGVNALQVTTFTFNDLTNAIDQISDSADEIVVRVTARVTDAGGVVNGDNMVNTGALSFTNGNGQTQTVEDTETVTLVEPNVTLDKSISPATADAGDTVTYTLRADNVGDGPAYDMIITDDVVGPEVVEVGTATITIFDAGGAVYTPTEAPTFAFDGAGELRVIVPELPAGHEVVIVYDAIVQNDVTFSSDYINTAEVARYDSNPLGDENTPPADPDEEERTYTGPTDTAEFSTPDATLDKSYLSSLDTNTVDGPPAELNIGEEVTYRLTITVPEGTADIVLTDALPPGLLAQSAEVISIGTTGDTATGLTVGDTEAAANLTIAPGTRDLVTFDFGTVVIDGSDDAAATATTIVVEVTSIVADIVALEDGDTLTNTATLALTDPNGGAPLQDPVVATETVEIVEPELELNKTGPVGADPGDTVAYSISVTNTGTGPAYDAVITDPFTDPDLTYVTTSAEVYLNGSLLNPQPTLTEPAPGEADGFEISGLTLLPNDVIRVDFNVELALTADEAETFTNTATVAYDSVEGDPVDADMNPLGRDDTDSDDHNLATVPRIEKAPVASQFTETDSVEGSAPFALAIGEEVTYRYVITLPEVALDPVIATDLLPPGTEFVSASIIDVTGTGADVGNFTVSQDLVNPNLVTFDFGAMTNVAPNGAVDDQDTIVFDVVARITNDGLANATDTLVNTVSLDVTPDGGAPFGTQTTTAEVFVVEPEISIEKDGPLALDPGGAAGTYTVTVTNDGVEGAEGPAYDLNISDALPAGMTLDTGSFSFATGGGATLTPESFTADADSFIAEFPLLLPGESIVITYEASLDAGQPPLTTFVNTASADFFSAPDDLVDAGDNPVALGYAPVTDDHEITSNPTLDKEAIASEHPETPENADGDAFQDLAIGETVTYELTLTLPEIPMDTVVLTDSLPVGLSFVSAEVTALGSEITVGGSTDLATVNAAAIQVQAGQDLTLTLADVVNISNDSIVVAEDAITVQIVARVDDDPLLVGTLPNSQLTNTAGLAITPEGEGTFAPVTATETVEIVEPALTVQKTAMTPAVNPGDEVDYSVTVTNDGTAPAFDVDFADAFLNPNLSLVTNTVTIALDSEVPSDITADVVVVESGDGFSFDLVDSGTGTPYEMPVGSTLTVTYTALLDANAPDAQTFLNTAVVGFDGLPGDPVDENGDLVDDRDYTADDDASVATVPFIVKTPTSSNFGETDSINGSDPFDLNIGEEVTYTYQLYLPEIDMDSVILDDQLSPGLEFVSFNLVSYGSDMTDLSDGVLGAPTVTQLNDQDFIVDFGGIRNNENTAPPTIGPDDIITIEVVARVTNDGVPSAGDTLPNVVSLEVIPSSGDPLATVTAEADIRVVEPELTIDKGGPSLIPPGGTGTFDITVANVGQAGAPDAVGPAYDVVIEDVLPAGVTITSAVDIMLNNMPYTPGVGELVTTPTGFTLDVPVMMPGDEFVFTYDGTLDIAADPISTYTNTATAEYDSAPGDPLDSNGDPVEETYAPVSDTHTFPLLPGLEKAAIGTGNAATPGLQIGETVTYELVMTLPELGMDTVVLTDTLPAGLSLVSAEITELGSGLSVDGATDLATVNADADFDTTGSLLTVTLNDVLNADSDQMTTRANDGIVVQVTARVDNVPGNGAGISLTNTAGLVIDPVGPLGPLPEVTDTETVGIVEPDLDIVKSGEVLGTPGSTVDYSLDVTNNGTGVAFSVVIADPLSDPSLSYASGSAQVFLNGSLMVPQPGVASVGSGFEVQIASLDPGDNIRVDFSADISASSPPGTEIPNTASVSFTSGPGGRPGGDSDDHTLVNGPGLEKTAFTSQFSETDSELGSTPFELTIGEEVTYRYEITLPEIALDSVVVSDQLPAGLEYVSVAVVDVAGTGASGTVSASPSASNPNFVTFDFGSMTNASDGSIGADDVLTFDVTARVVSDGSVSGGDVLVNSATLNVDPTDGAPFDPITDTAEVTVVEPQLDIQKTGSAEVAPGESGSFTITVTNDDAPGVGPAFDLALGDQLPPEFSLDVASLAYTIDGATVTPASVSANAAGFDVTFDVLDAGSVLEVSYDALLDANASPDAVFVNTAVAVSDTVPGDVLDENGDPVGEETDPVSDVHVIAPDGAATLQKTATSTEFAQTAEDGDGDGILGAAIGEEVTFTLVVTLPETNMDSVVLTDNLPDGLVFISGSVTQTGSDVSVNGGTEISNDGQVTTLTFLDVVNASANGEIGPEDQITVQIVARVDDVAGNVSDTQLTNTAGLVIDPEGDEPPLPEVVATDTIEVIEPELSIEKTTTALTAEVGDVITYSIVITNDDAANAPAFNAVVTDVLPADLSLTGSVVLSDPSLGSVTSGGQAGSEMLVVSIPVLQPGESLSIEFEVLVGADAGEILTNEAFIDAGSTPELNDPDGRNYPDSDIVNLQTPDGQPIDPVVIGEFETKRTVQTRAIDGIDDAQFLPVLLIDPIFTGTAEPGSNVTVNLYRQDGGLDYVRNIVADAGGHWIAIFPRVHFDSLYDDHGETFAGSVLFDAPVQLLDDRQTDSLNYQQAARTFQIESALSDEAYTLGVTVDRPSTLPQDQGIFNTRTFFAPSHTGEIFGTADILKVDDIFENVAFRSVSELYEGTADPLGVSLNRFNYEFLSAQTAVPGQQ